MLLIAMLYWYSKTHLLINWVLELLSYKGMISFIFGRTQIRKITSIHLPVICSYSI